MNQRIARRSFLKQMSVASAAIGFPSVIPAAVLGRDGAVGPNEKITLGCIGVGGMGTGNMKVFAGLEGCRVVAVCDTYEDRQQNAKRYVDNQYGNQDCKTYGDFREVLDRKDIDAVMIAPQDHWHALIATAAARAGKDMYCEKPMGVSVEEGQKILAAVRKQQRVFQAGTWQRSQQKFRHACELARNGYVGKVHTVQVSAPGPHYQPNYKGSLDPQSVPPGFDWERWCGPAPMKPYNPGRVAWPDWYLIWDYCAGFICNWGVHHLDIANWGCPQLGTEACEVECKATYRQKGFTDNVEGWNATFTFASGLKMTFTDETQQKVGTKFIGDQGWVHVDRAGIWAEPESLLKVNLKDDELHLHASNHHQDDFLSSVRSRQDPVSNVDATHVASYLGLIADIAARRGQKLKWDPKAEHFVDNDAANQMLKRPMHNGWQLS
jgi:predicted dehydrogenase